MNIHLGSEADIEAHKERYKEVLTDRNKLIHTQLAFLDFNDDEVCHSLIADLDAQLAKLQPLEKEIQDFIKKRNRYLQIIKDNPDLLLASKPPEHIIVDGQVITKQPS